MLSEITNYHEITPYLGTCGQPTREQFAQIRAAGYTHVINLATGQSPDAIPDEADLARGLGLRHHHIPVIWLAPTAENLADFFAVMDSLLLVPGTPEQKVLVHCVVNYRASCFTFLYRVLRLGVDIPTARADMNKIWQPEGVWAWFVAERLGQA